MNAPGLVAPYCGESQGKRPIRVPARIAYRQQEPEEGPWVMIPYGLLYPGGVEPVKLQGPFFGWAPRTRARELVQSERAFHRGIPIPAALYSAPGPRRMGSHKIL